MLNPYLVGQSIQNGRDQRDSEGLGCLFKSLGESLNSSESGYLLLSGSSFDFLLEELGFLGSGLALRGLDGTDAHVVVGGYYVVEER
jgi:hypothetical protein